MSERVDTLLLAAGAVLVVGGGALFVARAAWRLADRAVDWIAARRSSKAPAPAEHPAFDELLAARQIECLHLMADLRVAEHAQFAATLRGDRGRAVLAQRVVDRYRAELRELSRAEGSR